MSTKHNCSRLQCPKCCRAISLLKFVAIHAVQTDIQTNAPFRLNIHRMTQVAGLKKDIAQICSEQPESQVSAQTALCLKYEKWLIEGKKKKITDLLDFQKTLFWVIWGWALCRGNHLTFRVNNQSHSRNHRASHAKAKCQQHPQGTQLHKKHNCWTRIYGLTISQSLFAGALAKLLRSRDLTGRSETVLAGRLSTTQLPWREWRQMRLEAGDRNAGESVGRWEQPVADGARWNFTAPQTKQRLGF